MFQAVPGAGGGPPGGGVMDPGVPPGHMMQVNSPAGGPGSNPVGGQNQQNQAVVQQGQPQAQAQTASNQPQVSLSLLIEYLVQKIYHELNVLAELLPRKTDMERKVMIFQFASRTRMLFVRYVQFLQRFRIKDF